MITAAPTMVVANLPYSVATPLILRTIEQLPSLATWTVMVQREIADRLTISPKTADHHIQHIYGKIGTSTRAGAALWAMQHAFVQ